MATLGSNGGEGDEGGVGQEKPCRLCVSDGGIDGNIVVGQRRRVIRRQGVVSFIFRRRGVGARIIVSEIRRRVKRRRMDFGGEVYLLYIDY